MIEGEPLTQDDEAKGLYQGYLDVFSDLARRRDYDGMVRFVALPVLWEATDGSVRRFDSMDAFLAAIRDQREAWDEMRIHDYQRICEGASFANATKTEIEGTHRTYMLKGGMPVLTPYQSWMRLYLVDGIWKSSGQRTELRNTDFRRGR